MIAAVVLAPVLLLLVWRAARRRRERAMSADVMSDVLGTVGSYRGGRWKVGDPWI